jgi:D-glycero-alpha-D-manno-heptose-7-phosphate kinase
VLRVPRGRLRPRLAIAIENGTLGGKLVGAGGRRLPLFYTRDQARLRETMAAEGLAEVRFSFAHDGSTLIVRD